MAYVVAAAMTALSWLGVCAGKPDNRNPSVEALVDSIANGNSVYTDQEASRVIGWLEALRPHVPEDSLRLYATNALLNYSWYLMQGGEWYLCRNLLMKASRMLPPDEELLKHKIESALAGMYMYDGDYARAGRLFVDANDYFESARDTAEWLKSSINLGLYYTRTHNKNKALEMYGKVLKAAENPAYKMYYSITTGYAQKIEQDSTIDLAKFKKALDISLDNGYTFLLASNYNDMALYYYRLEDYHECLANARKGLKYAEKFNQTAMKILSLGTMADAYYAQKNYIDAFRVEAEKSKILQNEKDRMGKAIYSHLQMADSLVGWVDANVSETAGGSGVRMASDSGFWNGANIVLLIVAIASVMSFATGLVWFRRKKRDVPSAQTPVPASGDTLADNGSDLMYLHVLAEGFNPTLDKVRAMLKEVPRTGDQDADTKIRNVMTYLLQNRLPDSRTPLVESIRAKEEEFTGHLSENYPSLTKNDLKIALCIRCGLNARETSVVTGMQPKSVNQARYRLRKSLGLGQDDNLEAFVMSV